MKKTLIILTILIICLSGCSKQNNFERTVEDLSKYNISYKETFLFDGKLNTEWEKEGHVIERIDCYNVLVHERIDSLWNTADYVVIASPEISYSESQQFWFNKFNEPSDFQNISFTHSYSVRPFKVHKVYKGENLKLKQIDVCEHVMVNENEMCIAPGSYPTQQGTKYILFLFRANTEEERYFPILYQGKYSLNDSENVEQKNISKDMYKQVKEKFKDQIK